MQRRRRAHRCADVVRRHETPAGLGHRRDLLRFEQSAAVGDVGLDDLRRAEREQIPELGPRVQPLAGRNRDRHAARHLDECAGLVGGDRLLDPPRRQALEVARQSGGLGRGEPAVHFNEDLHVGSDGVPDRLHERHRPRVLGPLQFAPAGAERIELEGPVAPRRHPAGRLREHLGRPLPRVPSVGVGLDPVAAGSPQQPVHRLAERLADDVPARHLHDGDGGHLGGPGHLIIVANDPQQEVFDVEGIAPQDIPVGDRLEIRGDRLFPIDRARLADAFESFVGPKPPEHKVPPGRAHGVGLDLSDPHRRPPLRGSSIVILSGAARASPASFPRHPSRPAERTGWWCR